MIYEEIIELIFHWGLLKETRSIKEESILCLRCPGVLVSWPRVERVALTNELGLTLKKESGHLAL